MFPLPGIPFLLHPLSVWRTPTNSSFRNDLQALLLNPSSSPAPFPVYNLARAFGWLVGCVCLPLADELEDKDKGLVFLSLVSKHKAWHVVSVNCQMNTWRLEAEVHVDP